MAGETGMWGEKKITSRFIMKERESPVL